MRWFPVLLVPAILLPVAAGCTQDLVDPSDEAGSLGPQAASWARDDAAVADEDPQPGDAVTGGSAVAGALLIDALANDAGGSDAALRAVDGARFGAAAVVSGGQIRYTPPADWHGLDTLTYAATDGNSVSTARVVVEIRQRWDDEEEVNSAGMRFRRIPAGTFQMGSNLIDRVSGGSCRGCSREEKPVHEVRISRDFYMSVFETTQKAWKQVMGSDPSAFPACPAEVDDNCPVEQVSWNDAQAFAAALNQREGGDAYRLPTEAEWEYAARAGTTADYSFGQSYPPTLLDRYAWIADNAAGSTHPVGQKIPNAWGLHDVHGNVSEWVQDFFDGGYYGRSPAVDPPGPDAGLLRVNRGGSWDLDPSFHRSARRFGGSPDFRGNGLGIRLLREAP